MCCIHPLTQGRNRRPARTADCLAAHSACAGRIVARLKVDACGRGLPRLSRRYPDAGPELRLYDTADRQVRPVTPGTQPAKATMYVCGITPYDATHLGPRRHLPGVRSDPPALAGPRARGALRAERHRRRRSAVRARRPRRHRLARSRRPGGRAVPRRTWTALRVLPPQEYIGATEAIAEMVELVEKMVASGAAYVVDDEYPDVYFRADATPQFGYESGYDRDTMLRAVRAARRRPTPARQDRRTRRAAVACQQAGRAQLAVAVRSRPTRLARRMRGDRAHPHRRRAWISRAAAAT